MKFVIFAVIALVGLSQASLSAIQSSSSSPKASLPALLQTRALAGGLGQFLKGIWTGVSLSVKSDVRMLANCVAGGEGALRDLLVYIKFMKRFFRNIDTPDFAGLLDHIIELSGGVLANLLPCYIPAGYAARLLDLVMGLTWQKVAIRLALTIAANEELLYVGVAEFRGYAAKGDTLSAGEELGKIMYALAFH
ncbi:MAG: hypothetical protein P4L10_17180 [Acidobacteriaceae bacterium]|nr:hypothetical protein [Acidobacteriaceae bacterium]